MEPNALQQDTGGEGEYQGNNQRDPEATGPGGDSYLMVVLGLNGLAAPLHLRGTEHQLDGVGRLVRVLLLLSAPSTAPNPRKPTSR